MLQKKPETLGYSNAEVSAPEHPGNAELLAYWDSHRGPHDALKRADFNPLALPRLLPGVFLAEPADDDFRFRLVGSQIEDRMQRVLTGRSLTEIYGPQLGPQTAEIYRRVAAGNTPVTLRGHFVGDHLEHIDFEVMHLPMQFGDGGLGVLGGQFAFG